MGIKEQVRASVTSNFYTDDPAVLVGCQSLLDRGIVETTDVFENQQ